MCYQKSKLISEYYISNANIWEYKFELNITNEILKKHFSKECTNLGAGKTPLALPDPIHNTCVWGAKK